MQAPLKQLRRSVVRVVVSRRGGKKDPFVGTGFFIAPDIIVTCAHVVLRHVRLDLLLQGEGVKEKDGEVFLRKRYEKEVGKVEVELADGTRKRAEVIGFDGGRDVAALRVKGAEGEPLAAGAAASEGDDVFLCGFPYVIQAEPEEYPFAVHKGHVTCIRPLRNGGYRKRTMLQLQLMALGGASGSPVFSSESGKLVAMINGYMNWGADGVAMKDAGGKVTHEDLYVPLPLAFATPIKDVLRTARGLLA